MRITSALSILLSLAPACGPDPASTELLSSCSPGEGDRNTLRYSLDTGPRLDLRSGERGTLAIDTGHLYAVDLQLSGIDLYHDSERSLIRRVRGG
jgi:hypothetical protein